MSPEDERAWRVEQLERDVAELQRERAEDRTRIAVLTESVHNLAEQVNALWDENKWIRRLLIAAMVTVTTGAIGTATLVFVKVGGGPA